MKTFIYMNNEIRKPRPRKKVIVVQRGKQRRHANTVQLVDRNGRIVGAVKFRRTGLRGSPYHVRAWVELTDLKVRHA
jgi:hypothetical protein